MAPLDTLSAMRSQYVVGFAFDSDASDAHVALITKSHPEWQRGKLNGVGGHIEQADPTPHAAQVREFEEEMGVYIPEWLHVCTILGGHPTDPERQFALYVFAAFGVNLTAVFDGAQVHSPDEPVSIFNVRDLPKHMIPNLNFLIPMALNSNRADWPLLVIENGGDKV